MRTVLLALAFVLLGAATPRPLEPHMAAAIGSAARAALARQDVAGMTIAIAERGRIVFARGYGLRNADDRIPADPQTAYPIGSNTKQFTAAAILLLQQDGKLDIRDRLAKYLPDAPHAGEVTLENLLAQTSGLPDYTQTPQYTKDFRNPVSAAQVLGTIRGKPLSFKPGTSWEYSNTNYFLLSLVVAKVSGARYHDFVRERLLAPLRLNTASFDSHDAVRADTARGYTAFALGVLHHARYEDYSWMAGAGDLSMSAVDLARWDVALDSGKVVGRKAFIAMSTPKRLPGGKSTDYGFGLGAGTAFLGRPLVGHLGGLGGFISEDLTVPTDHLAIVIIGNGDTFNPVPIGHQIMALLYGKALPKQHPVALRQSAGEAAQARLWVQRALAGNIRRTQTTTGFAGWLMPTPDAARSMQSDLAALGERLGRPRKMELIGRNGPPGVRAYAYRVVFAKDVLEFDFALSPSGKLDYLNFTPAYDY